MSEPAGVSLVVVNWNSRDLVLRLLSDLESGWERPHEIVVVDNASEDRSVPAIRERFPEVRVIESERNLGFAAGVNRGIGASRYPFVLLVNPDVRGEVAGVEALCRYLEAHPEVAVVGPRILNEDGTLQRSYWRFPSLSRLFLSSFGLARLFPGSALCNGEYYANRRFDEPTRVDAVSGCVFLVRRSVVDRVGGLDEEFFMYFEETDWCRRIAAAGYQVHYAPVATFVHELGGSSRLARTRNFVEFRRSLLRYHRKHGGRAAALVARLLLASGLLLRTAYWGLRALGSRGAARELRMHLVALADLLVHRIDPRCREVTPNSS